MVFEMDIWRSNVCLLTGVTLRPWSRDDAGFIAEACADPVIRRYNGVLDWLGRLTSPLSVVDAEAIIDEFALNWRGFATTETPSGVAFAITDARSGELIGCCGVDEWSKPDGAQFGCWIGASARGRGYATRAVILLTRWLFELDVSCSDGDRGIRDHLRNRACHPTGCNACASPDRGAEPRRKWFFDP